jgi:Tfp pilus assembly protein PilO
VSVERPLWRRWLLPAAIVLAAVNLLAFAVWTLPRGLRQRSASSRAETARLEAQHAREATGRLRERVAAIQANGADVERFYARSTGTERKDLVPILEELEKMARSPGLHPGARGYGRSEMKNTPLERVTITLPLSGSYDQLVGFLREIERAPRFLTVDGVSLHADQGNARLQVQISAYLRVAPGEIVAGRGGRAR